MWYHKLNPWSSHSLVQTAVRERDSRRPATCPLAVEALEDRTVPASLSISDITVPEGVSGTHNAEVIVKLSAPSNKTVTVNYLTTALFAGTATAGSDYTAVSGRLTFTAGQIAKTILVPIHGDRQVEGNEFFEIMLQRPKGATIADYWGVVTIQDSTPRISVSDWVMATESDGFMTFIVSLSAAYDLPVTVNFATQDGFYDPYSGYDAAIAGLDYVATSGTLTFAPGETTKTVTVQLIEDMTPESEEVLILRLSGATNASIANSGWFNGLITDDDYWF
jgi:hypothetical protein